MKHTKLMKPNKYYYHVLIKTFYKNQSSNEVFLFPCNLVFKGRNVQKQFCLITLSLITLTKILHKKFQCDGS